MPIKINSLVAVAVLVVGPSFVPDGRAAEPEAETSPVRFGEQLIADGYGYAYGIAAADLDGDGDLDLTSSDTTNDTLYWFENDGKGNLTRRVIFDHDPGWYERHAVGDINGDGHPDIVIVKNKAGDLLWFENPGQPRESDRWKRHVITEGTLPGMYDVALGDFDDDGDLDAAVSSWRRGNLFAWYENDGSPESGKPWMTHIIEQNIDETRTIAAADLNSDGRLDLLGTGRVAGVVLWYENTGRAGEERWSKHVIDDRSPLPTHGHPVDMDKDGDLDVIMALGMLSTPEMPNANQVAWYENAGAPGDGLKWTKHVIGEMVFGFEAVAGDLDGDGDLDAVATAWGKNTGSLAWFENPGKPQDEWRRHVLKTNWPNANSVIVMDLDGDGRLDIAATAERGANEFRWWRNLGPSKE